MSNIYTKKKNGFLKFVMLLIIVLLLGAVGFVSVSSEFEQNKPKIQIDNTIYWNLKDDLHITLSDDSGIKYYKVIYDDNNKKIDLASKVLDGTNKNITLNIAPPKLDMFYKNKDVKLYIEVVDTSKWNMLEGNKATKTVQVHIDNKRPIANVISNSRYIRRGGSAIVITKVEDPNLKKAYIMFNDKIKFDLIPFYKDNYFVSLIAWDVNIENFTRVNLIAIDKANNKTITKIPFYIQPLRSKNDTINISKHFIENVSTNVLEQMDMKVPADLKDRFIEQNRVLRAKNIQTLKEIYTKNIDKSFVSDFNIRAFKRLRGSRTAAGFAERRTYIYEGEAIDKAWHLGIDWASVKHAPIKVSNSGKVVFEQYLGIYGNTIVIDHGMGLASLYAHTSTQDVNLGDEVRRNQKIANTGTTGAVMGDHLHFGILVQGIEVNPLEWMDKNWIKNNITKTIQNAKKEIDKK